MSSNFSTNPNAAPAPVSFDNFSFSFSRPSLLQRLGMNGPSNPPPPNGGDDLTIPTSLDTSNYLAAEGTSNTIPISSADSSSVPPASVISQQNSVIASQPTNMDPAEPNIRGMSPSDVPMEIDERASPDAGESPVTPTLSSGSRVPEIYRSLSPTNYFVAPPDVLPYPRSPVRQFPEGHPLHTQPSIFGYLPRVPPRSPRLDPLAVLELESERERSEWDQVRKDLGRPSRPTSPVVRAPPAPLDVFALPRSNNPSSAVDASFIAFSESGYESESSDAELRVFDHDDETPTTSHPATGSVHRTLVPLGAQPLGGTGPITAPPGPTSTSVPNLNGRFSGTETQPTFNAGGPASTPPPKEHKDKSGESGASTPAKRKFDEVEQPAHGSTKGFENKAAGRPSEERGGVPPPLRLQLDRVPTSQSGTPTPPPSVPSTARPTPATATSASTDQVGQSSIASAPGSAPASSNLATVATAPATRNICKFHNRPPGRVCVRKDACPDLHEGPLQAPAPWTYLQSSTPPLKTPPATEQSTFVVQPPPTVAPGTVPAPAPASVPAPIASAPKAAPAKTSPNAPIASATVVPPQGVSTPAPGPVPPQTGPSKATRSQTAASKATRAPATVPNPKPAASTDGTRAPAKENRRAPPACRFYSTPKGCGKGANCPFKHEDKNASGSASGPTSSSTTPQPIRSGDAPSSQAPVPTPGPSQVTLAQPNGPGPQTRKTSSGNVLKPAPNHSLPPKPAAFIGSGAGDLPPRELGVVQQPSSTNAQASSPNQKTKPPQAAKKKASQANTTKIKVEESSPGPSLSQNTPAPQVDRPTARPAPVTREIKQEDVTLYDIGQADEEMTDNTAQASSNGGSILPTSLTAPARPPGVPPPASSLPATQGAAPVNPAASIHARISPPQPTAESAAPLAASPIPVAPSRPPANGQKVASNAPAPPANQRSVSSSNAKPTSSASSRPSGPPVSQTARVPEARQEPERRELLSRLQERPEPRRTGADTYRPAYQGQPRLPRSASRSRSPVRSRSRSISPRRGNTRATRYREYSPIIRSPSPPRQSLYARFGGVDRNQGRVERRRPRSRSRSRSPGRYCQSYSPMEWAPRSPGPRNRSPPSSRSRSRSPPRRANYNDREYEYRGATVTRAPVSRNRSPPPQRTVAPAPRDGYSGGSAYFPPENHIPRPWERTQSSGTTSTSGVGESASAARVEQDSRHPRASKPRLVDMFEMPSGSSTPGGARPAATYAQSNPEPILDGGYDYDHSRTMDISPPDSPIPQYHLQDRLQDRINPPSGYHTPTESGGALLTRMAQDIEPPALLERVSSARGPPPNRAPQRGAAPPGNRAQRAPARHPGENAPPLSHRLMDERGSYPDYYTQPADMNPPHRNSDVIGGTLMARMVGRTTD